MNTRLAVDYLVYLVARISICIVQALRIETGERLAGIMAWLFCNVLRIRERVIDENLAHAFPAMSPAARKRLARRMWNHLFLLVLEVAHAPRKIHETNWRQYIALKDEAELVRDLLDDRPTLIVTAHLGNFEVGGFVLGILGFPTYTIARTLDNPFLDRFLNEFRGKTGQRIIPKNGGYDQIVSVLSGGGAMTFLADQYAGAKGCWVEFFGRPASAHKAIALLALEHNAVVSVCASLRRGRPMRFELNNHAMLDPRDAADSLHTIPDMTQWYTSQLEELIRGAPDQYWWLHRRWKDTRRLRARKGPSPAATARKSAERRRTSAGRAGKCPDRQL
ncbi:MAG: lysophospholipid acyltransferase family protein [Pirellulaceae bacterium]|nr:lysophospholipid acyltransferase family protein [Pirellulaceae bacterium]